MLIVVAQSNLAAALLLSLYTLADPTITLFRRAAAREPIFSAHRTHFYQRGVDRRLERAASDDAHFPALLSARRAGNRHGGGG